MNPATKLPNGSSIPDTPVESLSDTPVESLNPPSERRVTMQWEAAIDARLKHLDVRVLLILKGCQWGNEPVRLGRRKLAQYACSSQRLVADAVARLKKYGWLETFPPTNRRDRMGYKVTPVKFEQSKVIESGKCKIRRELVNCPICQAKCRQILKVGWCRKCNWKREVGKVAREVVREEKAS